MQRIASLLVGGAVLAGHVFAAGAAPCPPLMIWQPAGAGEPAAATRRALEHNGRARGCKVLSAPAEKIADSPSLAQGLAAAIADYRGFKFGEAAARLEQLAQAAQAMGGGDLDARGLAELYLYRGLSRSELGQANAAWDDFVRAARLDPARVLDPAQFPPRVVAAYRRAAEDAVQLPRAKVRVVAPAGARVQLDGRNASGTLEVPLGAHFVRVEAAGYEPFGGAVDVTATDEDLTPPLVALRAPPAEKLVSLAGGAPALIAIIARGESGWRLALRSVAADGTAHVLERPVDVDSAEPAADALLHELLDPPSPSAAGSTATSDNTATAARAHKKMPAWGWGLLGAAAVTIAVVLPIAIVFGPPTPSGTVGGNIGPLK